MSRFQPPLRAQRTKTRMLIVCEGSETEPRYFEKLKLERTVVDRFNVKVVGANGGSAFDVVHFAVKKLKAADQNGEAFHKLWCVLDVESQEGKVTRRMKEAIELANQYNIDLIWSNPCFERWFLSHFERSSRAIRDCSEMIACLNRYWIEKFGRAYEKNESNTYLTLKSWIHDAIANATHALAEHRKKGRHILDANSATQVHELVTHLLGRAIAK